MGRDGDYRRIRGDRLHRRLQEGSKEGYRGLSARAKLVLQGAIAVGLCMWLWYGDTGLPEEWVNQVRIVGETGDVRELGLLRNRLALPFVSFNKHPISLPSWAYVAFASFVIVGTSNAVNLTDGLDGLAIGR